jgi:hypothetical protein
VVPRVSYDYVILLCRVPFLSVAKSAVGAEGPMSYIGVNCVYRYTDRRVINFNEPLF